jgi:hypothetical protein
MPSSRRPESQRRRAETTHGIVVAVYGNHLQVQKALAKLARSRLDLRQVSVVSTDYHTEENVYGYYSTGPSLEAWGSLGSFWKAVWAALTGGGVFFIPGVGAVVVGGPMVGWLVATLENGTLVSGLSVLGVTLLGNGIPSESALEYETAVRSNEFLLLTSGSLLELATAKSLLKSTGARARIHES